MKLLVLMKGENKTRSLTHTYTSTRAYTSGMRKKNSTLLGTCFAKNSQLLKC